MCRKEVLSRFQDKRNPDVIHEVTVKCPRQGRNHEWCYPCRVQYVYDYVGRCLAEAAVSDFTTTCTLTYAPREDLSDKLINPVHFQKFVRSLRRRGHHIRYLAVGEYGDRKGRAHFHACLFVRGQAIEIPEKKRAWLDAWPHGHTMWDHHLTPRAIKYVCKYLLKSSAKETWKSQSTKPALGWEWFKSKADELIDLGVYPTSFEYRPPNYHGRTQFFMRGAVRRDYLRYIRAGLGDGYKDNVDNLNEWVERGYRTLDTIEERERDERRAMSEQFEELRESLEHKRPSQAGVNAMLVDTFSGLIDNDPE